MKATFLHNMKRYLLLFLLPLYAIVDSSAYDFEKDGIYYAIKSADNLEVKVVSKAEFTTSYSGDVTIPESVEHEGNTYRVTEIFINAFSNCRDLTSVVVPGSVTQIGDYAFRNCRRLHSVTLSEGVTQIGDSAFVNCWNLKSVSFSDSVVKIGDYAFRNCSRLSSVVIPDGVGEIGEGLFYNCTGLISATIPGSVTQIGDYAFLGCLGLTSAALSEGVIQIGDSAFVNCQNLGSVIIPSSVTSIGKYAFRSCRGLSSAIIPEGVNEIEEGLFYYCKELTEITLPGGIAKIGDKAFYECSHLLAVEFPSKIKEIGVSAFDGCSGLTAVSIPDSITYISRSAFNNCVRLSSVTVSENVKEIGRYAFDNTLWYSNQPEGAVYINDILYKYKGVLPIDSEIVIKEGTTTISDIAFMEQTGLRSVIFPESMARMGGEIFNGCSGLSEIECKAAVPPVCDKNCFLGISRSKCKLYVPMNAMTSYRDSLGWNGFRIFANNMFDRDPVWEYIETTAGKRDNLTVTHRYRVENPVAIDGKIYYNLVYENNASGTFGQNVDVILKKIREEDGRILVDYEEYKRYCDREHIDYIPYKVTDGELVLYDFNMKVGDRYEHVDGYEDIWISEIRRIRTKDGKLRKLFILNNGVEFMEGIGCLSACKQPLLNYLNPVNDDISISLASFSDTGGLVYWQSDVENFCFEVGGVYYRYSETVRPGVSVTYKRGYPEYSGDVTIPETVKYGGQTYRVVAIDEFAFKNCEYMTSVSLPEGLIAIGDNSFADCRGLTSLSIPSSVETIGGYAFTNCTGLTSVKMSEGVAEIGEGAFFGCSGLKEVAIPGSVISIGDYAFKQCVGLTVAQISEGVVEIGSSAFCDCQGLQSVTIPGSVVEIGDYAFRNCGRLASVAIPEGVTGISEGLFYSCTELTEIALPNCIAEIGDYAFMDCQGLTSVMIPEDVVQIGDSAFVNCRRLETVTIPGSVAKVGDYAFRNCIRLSSVIIPDGVSEIGEGLFYNCTALNEVTLSGNVARIGDYAFYECWHLSSLTIPGSVSSIGQEAFSGCTGLTEITCKAAVPPICEADCFLGVGQRDCKLYVPEVSVEAYRNAPVWQNFDIIATDFSGIEGISAEGSVRIYASGGSIVLENLSPGMPVAVYDTTGRKVKTVEATGSRMEVALPAGFYVVECAGKVEKVMLRALSGRI